MTLPFPLRFERQEQLVPRSRVLRESATVIGVGAVGRQVALLLVAFGVPKLQLIDYATVKPTDVTSQGFLSEDVGRPKVDAVGGLCHRAEPLLDLDTVCEPFRSSLEVGSSVFCCVDTPTDRAAIRDACHERCRFWGDGRIGAQKVRVLAAATPWERKRCREALSTQSDDDVELAHTSAAYVGALAAALLMQQFVRSLRNEPLNVDSSFDLAAGKYVVADEPT